MTPNARDLPSTRRPGGVTSCGCTLQLGHAILGDDLYAPPDVAARAMARTRNHWSSPTRDRASDGGQGRGAVLVRVIVLVRAVVNSPVMLTQKAMSSLVPASPSAPAPSSSMKS